MLANRAIERPELLFSCLLRAEALPVRGSLPDMAASSDRYVALQRVYREQASLDAAAVLTHAQQLLADMGVVCCNPIYSSLLRIRCPLPIAHCQPYSLHFHSYSLHSPSPHSFFSLFHLIETAKKIFLKLFFLLRPFSSHSA